MTHEPRPRVAVLDYDAGNVRSAQRRLAAVGAASWVTTDPDEASEADAIVVPGVGNLATCMASLHRLGLAALLERWTGDGRPLLGICVGMQLLYERSAEGDAEGLGLLPGEVERFPEGTVVPHLGWDVVRPVVADDELLDGVAGQRCYFVHSYYAVPRDAAHVLARTVYGGVDVPSVVRHGNVVATQFHPEKSGEVGGRLLANWVRSLPRRDVR